jgi:hypothetical protein
MIWEKVRNFKFSVTTYYEENYKIIAKLLTPPPYNHPLIITASSKSVSIDSLDFVDGMDVSAVFELDFLCDC